MGAAKILVVGGIRGQFKKAFEKIFKLQVKQSFTLALVVGDLFADEGDEASLEELGLLLQGQISIPLPTYFTVGDVAIPSSAREKLEASGELCENLFYLGRKGTLTTSDGIKIVNLGGRLVQNDASLTQKLETYDPLYLDTDARGLHGAHSAHILITNEWPAGIGNGSDIPIPEDSHKGSGSLSVSNLCSTLKPWYHFSASDYLWEREPFKHVADYDSLDQTSVTRFKSLPPVSAPTKEWMTAFALDNAKPPPTVGTPRDSPFIRAPVPRKRAIGDHEAHGHRDRENGHRGRRNKRQRTDPSDCFMCLNKPEFKQHMVVSIGDESMVTTSRGPLSLPSTFPQLSFSGHVMIIPHYHAADELAQGRRAPAEVTNEFQEMNKFRKALSTMIGCKSQGQLGAVCWEVNRTGIRHLHWQAIACPAEHLKKGLVEAAFKVSREKKEYPDFENCDPEKQLDEVSDYFRVWTWVADPVQIADRTNGNNEKELGVTKSMYFHLPTDLKFNIWFGREVMAGLLQLENRLNWMDALLRKDGDEQAAEEEDAQGLKDDFEEFDFAMA